nr:hypothetical protein [Tanacetum cinerariifolium]
MPAIIFVGLGKLMGYFRGIQVAQKKVKIAFENADSSSRVELIPSKIKFRSRLLKIQVAQKKIKKAFENADSSSRVELIPSKIKYANKVPDGLPVVTLHKYVQNGVDQLTEDPSSYGQKDIVFVKSSADDTKVSIPGLESPCLSKVKCFILQNHDTCMILPAESQRNTLDPSVAVTNSSVTDYDSADESSVCSIPLPPLKKLDGAEPT